MRQHFERLRLAGLGGVERRHQVGALHHRHFDARIGKRERAHRHRWRLLRPHARRDGIVAGDLAVGLLGELAAASGSTSPAIKLAEETYGKLPANKNIVPRLRPQEPPPVAVRSLTLADPRVEQLMLQRAYLVPSFNTAKPGQSEALEVLSLILGTKRGRPLLARVGRRQARRGRSRHPLRQRRARYDQVQPLCHAAVGREPAAARRRDRRGSSPRWSTRASIRRNWRALRQG